MIRPTQASWGLMLLCNLVYAAFAFRMASPNPRLLHMTADVHPHTHTHTHNPNPNAYPNGNPTPNPFLSPDALELAKAGNKFEKIKLEKDGSVMFEEVHAFAEAIRSGKTSWDQLHLDDIDIRLKWAGLFHRRKRTPGSFMIRLRVPNGILTSDQMRFMGKSVQQYGEKGCVDITTRQNIQLRGMPLEAAADICKGVYDIGLSSVMSGMDNVRNLVGSPLAGIDPHEIYDTRQLCTDLNDMITNHRVGNVEFSNLPRKFNIAISGSRDDFAHTYINDVGLRPVVNQAGQVGFNVYLGGYFSIKRVATTVPMNVWIPSHQAVPFCRAVLEVFRDHGARGDRQKSRLMWLIEEWGMDRFTSTVLETIRTRVPDAEFFRSIPEPSEPFPHRDILGIHAQAQPGLVWVGANIPVGRLTSEDCYELARIADTYSHGELRLTVDQNVLFPNVASSDVDAMVADPQLQNKFQVHPGPLSGGLVSCTGAQFCGVALIETKNRAVALTRKLEETLDIRQHVRIHWTGCPNSCGQAQLADIGIMGSAARVDGKAVEGVDVFMGGDVGEHAKLGDKVLTKIPAAEESLVPVLQQLLIDKFGATLKL